MYRPGDIRVKSRWLESNERYQGYVFKFLVNSAVEFKLIRSLSWFQATGNDVMQFPPSRVSKQLLLFDSSLIC